MKINKSSWHYRLIEALHKTPSNNLCAYTWQVVGSLVAIAVAITMIAFMIVAALSSVGMFFIIHYVDFQVDEPPRWALLCIGLGIMGWIMGLIYLFSKICDHFEKSGREKQKEPSIIVEYIRAKKQKICPLIEFEESK